MSPQEVQHFLVVCALASDLYCPGYNPRQPLGKDSNLSPYRCPLQDRHRADCPPKFAKNSRNLHSELLPRRAKRQKRSRSKSQTRKCMRAAPVARPAVFYAAAARVRRILDAVIFCAMASRSFRFGSAALLKHFVSL